MQFIHNDNKIQFNESKSKAMLITRRGAMMSFIY
jgi:hypothetical protein